MDDADILSTLERCFKLIHEPNRPLHSLELPANSVPGSATSLRQSITSYLARFLKRSIFDKIKYRQTRLDHNLFDVIWPAMKKATKERRIDEDLNAGVVAPDFDIYVVFQEFMVPLIKDIHCIDVNQEFQPHPKTEYFEGDLDNGESITATTPSDTKNEIQVLDDLRDIRLNLDISKKYITAGVAECSRNLDDFELPLNLNIAQLEQAERAITGKLFDLEFVKAIGEEDLGVYYTMNEILENPSEVRAVLASNGLLIPLLDNNDINQVAESIAINGQFWPYGRGVLVSSNGDFAVWINTQEHIRILCCTSNEYPGDMGMAYTKIGKAINYLQKKLQFRNSYLLGHLASRPSYLGTSLHLTYTITMPHLMKEIENLRHLCTVRGLHMIANPNTDTIRISNMQSMGVTEWKLFQNYCTAVANILQLEKDLSLSNTKHIAAMLVSIFRKKKSLVLEST